MIITKRCVFASLLVFALSSAVLADFNAATFVSQFNSANSGKGLYFTWSIEESYNETQLNFTPGAVDLSAYNSNTSGIYNGTANPGNRGKEYFRTFCIEPYVQIGNSYGKLSYNSSTGRSSISSTNSAYNGKTVNLGTAVLYSQFASGTLADYNRGNNSQHSADATLLQTAIQATIGVTTVTNWSSNKYLAQLLAINSSQSYWMGYYDPNQYYSQVGDYAVFAMNVTASSSNTNWQDFLYVVKVSRDTGVPEPATLLFWSLGGLTFAGAKLRRRK